MSTYQVDSEDANFLFLENTDSPTHISLVYLYDQSTLGDRVLRFTEVRRHIEDLLSASPVFRQKVHFAPANVDYPYWVDDESFDLDFHVRHLGLPKPGDWRQFCIQVSRLHSRPLDMSRPLWELYVIEGLDRLDGLPPHCFALYFKIHHCAVDEFTAQELMESLHAYAARTPMRAHAAVSVAHPPARKPALRELLVRAVVNNSVRSTRLLLQSLRNFRLLSRALAQLSLGSANRAIEREAGAGRESRRFARRLGTSRVFEGGGYPRRILDDYAATVPGATISHALLAICGEALRRYLEHHGETSAEPLSAFLQVNVRNAGAHAMAGNHIAVNHVELGTHVEFPGDRLQAVYSANKELHSIEREELTSFRLRSLYENLPAPLLAWLGHVANQGSSFNRRLMKEADCGIAEMFGPDRPLYMLGTRLLGFTGIPPLYSGCGLMFTVSTYCDGAWITFTSDRAMMPDPQAMRQCLDAVVADVDGWLARQADPGPAARRRRTRRTTSSRKPGRTAA